MVGKDHWDWAFSLLVPVATHQSNSESKEICAAQGVTVQRHSTCGAFCPKVLPA